MLFFSDMQPFDSPTGNSTILHKKVLISLWQELGFSLSAFASNCSDLLTIPSSHLPNYYFSVAPCAPSSCDPIFSLAEVSKRSGAMTKDLFLNSGNLCMILRAERNNEVPATSKVFLGQRPT